MYADISATEHAMHVRSAVNISLRLDQTIVKKPNFCALHFPKQSSSAKRLVKSVHAKVYDIATLLYAKFRMNVAQRQPF
jgi:hypothetical protein